MAVDRGGLRYSIVVENQFSEAIRDFRAGVAGAKKAFTDFKTTIQSSRSETLNTSKALNILNQSLRRVTNSQAAAATATVNATRQILAAKQAEVAANNLLLSQRRSLNQGARGGANAQITALRQETSAVNVLTAAYRRLETARRRAGARIPTVARPITPAFNTPLTGAAGGARSPGPGAGILPRGAGQLTALTRFQSILGSSQAAADRASFSFQRLFTVLFAFAAVRVVTQGFTDIVSRMITFNKVVETAQLGIASLFLALGDVRDAQGETTTGAQGLALAQAEARKQTALLRRDALATAASFEQLLETFQVGIAPGLQAGLNIDQIRQFTVQISQAASAIGLPQRQLAEEIRSILSGTINVRSTRIAASLGITNQDIRNAKEQGKLIGFLQTKFAAFTTAGQEAFGTFDVLFQSVNEAFTALIGAGGFEFFVQLKTLLREIFDTITVTDPLTRILTPNPEAVSLIRNIADGLNVAVEEARRLGKELGFEGIVGITRSIGSGIAFIAQVLSGIIVGLVKGVNDLRGIASVIVDIIRGLTGVDLFKVVDVSQVAEIITRIAVVFGGIVLAAKAFALAFAPIVIAGTTLITIFTGLFTLAKGVFAVFSGALTLLTSVTGFSLALPLAVIALAEGTKKWLSELTGVELKYSTIFKLVQNELDATLVRASLNIDQDLQSIVSNVKTIGLSVAKFLEFAFLSISGLAIQVFGDVVSKIGEGISKINEDLGKGIVDFGEKALEKAQDIEATRTKALAARNKELELEAKNLALLESQTAEAKRLAEARAQKRFDETIKNADKDPTLAELGLGFVKDIGQKLSDEISGALKGFLPDTDEIQKRLKESFEAGKNEAVDLSKVFKELPGIINVSRDSVSGSAEAARQMAEELIKAEDTLRQGISTLGLGGRVLQQRSESLQNEVKIREANKKLLVEESNAQSKLRGIQVQRLQAQERFNALTVAEQQIVLAGEQIGNAQLEQARTVFQLRAKVAEEQANLNRAIQEGNTKEQAAAQERLRVAEAVLEVTKQNLADAEGAAKALLSDVPVEKQKELSKAITDRIVLSGQEKQVTEEIADIKQDQVKTERTLTEQLAKKISLLSQQEVFELQQQNSLTAIQNANARATFESRFALRSEQAVVAAKNELRLTTEQVVQARKIRDLNFEALQILLEQAKAKFALLSIDRLTVTDPVQRAKRDSEFDTANSLVLNLEKQIGVQRDANNLKLEEENLLLEKANENLTHARAIIEQPISTGIIDGFRQAAQELPSLYEGIVNGIKSTVTSLTDFISTSIVDAFDPTKDFDIQERFARFLQDIAKQVLQMFVQLAIARAILNIGFGGFGGGIGGAAGGLGGLGFAKGGQIPHRKAGGYAKGSKIRPTNLAPSDTVPIWAAPGEWVIRARSAAKYGADVMNAINRGLVDPFSLRAVAGLGSVKQRLKASTGPGFAEGGLIRGFSGTGRSGGQRAREDRQNAMPQSSFVIANDQNVERLLSGGKNAVLAFMQDNKGRIGAILKT